MTTRTGRMADRVNKDWEDYCEESEITHLRITSDFGPDGREWALDAANHDGSLFSEACWTFDSFDDAVAAMPDFAYLHALHLLEG